MVGVAGKSKGCNTCRKRKVACDQERPACARCTRSNRVCGGYERERVFVLVQPAAEKKHIFLKPHSLEVSSHSKVLQNGSEALELLPASTRVRSHEAFYSFAERGMAYVAMQNRNERHSLIQAFLSTCFPAQHPPSTSRSWISLLGELPTGGNALDLSSAAIAASVIGRSFQNNTLIRESLKLYTQGLQQLQRALWDPNLMREDGTLAACMALSLYEALECPSAGSDGYFSHCKGILALVQARGVYAHSSGAGHQLFLGVRIPGILYGLECQTPNFLFDSIWIEQPWRGTQKPFFHQVADCLSQAPSILQRVQTLPHLSPDQQAQLIHDLVRECWQIDGSLDRIYDEMHFATSEPLYWLVPSQSNLCAVTGPCRNLFPVSFCFTDPESATTLILLWAVRVMLWSGLCNLYRIPIPEISVDRVVHTSPVNTSTGEIFEPLPPLGHRLDYPAMVHHVCQSVEYLLQDELLLAGPLSVSLALGIVIDTIREEPRCVQEATWLQTALEVVQRRGLGVLKYARSGR
ncbi:hypothetical protein ABOM_002741 [Aspergillus bombycis]|uniref:Zn(2)-C6 fungal-type domain-containing protein n=1 Tax=Aspergillus bombycis TaxID=109264 RepID=A0A1F8A9P7_9EURO|nr:hypothetical protein ABOM_002741 [Aspergillus bombycis]OGM48028.1 hypothetical protein ABOM_002741 [Aspergillus bombycis]